jgi:phosphotransferase system enzyme I (PtsI)
VCLHNEDVLESVSRVDIAEDGVAEEKKRLIGAIERTKEELRRSYDAIAKSLGAMEAEVFNAHILILEDFPFINQIEETIERELVNAEYALLHTAKSYEQRFSSLPSDYFRERTQDIDDITRRLLKNMGVQHTGFMCVCPVGQPVVIVANELTPSLIAALGGKEVAGIVTEKGSAISHGAILAKALGVPAMIGVERLIASVSCGMDLLIDADEGFVYPNPDPETIMNYHSQLTVKVPVTTRFGLGYTTTRDGVKVHLAANAGNVKDIENAGKHGVKNIGLFRTELLFLGREHEPDVDEQVDVYRKVIAATNGAVTFRLLDIGGDKILDYLLLPQQNNPNLGLRGVRV